MRRKTFRGGRAATSAKPSNRTVRAIPFLVSQDEVDASLPKTSIESNHDIRDVREVGSKGNMDDGMDKGSNRSPHDSLGHEYLGIDLLDGRTCISCNEGGEVLVCGERDCPVALHAKCVFYEPKFDDMGNFYCSYCWYKRAVAEVQELRKKAMTAKKDLSKFLDKNVLTGEKLAQKEGEAKRKELKELPLAGNGSCLDHCNRQGNDCVHSRPLQTEGDQPKEMERETAQADQHGIAVESDDHENSLVANTSDFSHYREEKTPAHIELVHNSKNREKFDVHNIFETHETRFVEGKDGIGPEDPRYNDENVHERIVEEPNPLSAYHSGKYRDGHSMDITFANGTQESLAVSNKVRMKDTEKVLQNELKVPATDSSVSETIESDSEALSMEKVHGKTRAQKTAYPRRTSARKSLSLKSNTEGKNACFKNEEVTTSKSLRQPQGSSKQAKKQTLSTGKRKRLKWSTEEENMLKEGVLRFSTENQNIPWKKILEFGRDVFDDTRTPVDLKDKWKNITAKEGRN